jgi:antitoxin component YwqK of YwqJK toxin-antitoxin module
MIINFLFKLDKTKNNLEGEKTNYYGSGEKLLEGTYKDGERDGLFTRWYKNGQKWKEGTYKNGKFDGLYTIWYENGQKKFEGTYEDGELISKKYWDEDGSVIE